MAVFGINVMDGNGKVFLDNEKLLHRVIHKGVYTVNTTIYYAQPLNHEPTIVTYGGVTGKFACLVSHVINAGSYVGFTLTFGKYGSGTTMVIVFARR